MVDRTVTELLISQLKGMSPDAAREFLSTLAESVATPAPRGQAGPPGVKYGLNGAIRETPEQSRLLAEGREQSLRQIKAQLIASAKDMGGGLLAVNELQAAGLANTYHVDADDLISEIQAEHHEAFVAANTPAPVKPVRQSAAENLITQLGMDGLLEESNNGNETE